VKKFWELALGIVTSVGGFLEVGSIATAAQGGAAFGYQLTWAIVVGTLALIVLVEMSGRLAAISKHTLVDAIRERFGFDFFVVPLLALGLVTFLVLASEIGGVALALQMLSGISFRWWALPVGLLAWLLLWKGTFGLIEKGVSLLGIVTIAFAIGAWKLHPNWPGVATGMLPSLPGHDGARYWFTAVAIIGASISPYLFFFYSAGAIEDHWNEGDLGMNRAIAALGMSFGGVLSVAVLVGAALVFHPRDIRVDSYDQVALILTTSLGRWGFFLFIASLAIACFGATLEIALALAYLCAQGLGWNWGEDQRPRDDSRFCLVYTAAIALGIVPLLLGLDPLALTVLSMALTAVALPAGVLPFLLLMNDVHYVQHHRNGLITNVVVSLIVVLSFVVAVVAIPLQLFGG
jgi:Mn2+/Fe2+ NRAMP family transporter